MMHSDSDNSTTFVIAMVICSINVMILTPIMIRYSWKLYKHSSETIIKKRYPKITLCICLFAIITICCDSILYAIFWLSFGNDSISILIRYLEAIIYSIVSSAYIWSMVARYWKMYYYRM